MNTREAGISDADTSYDLVAFDKRLVAQQRPTLEPQGTQILIRARKSGVCDFGLYIYECSFD